MTIDAMTKYNQESLQKDVDYMFPAFRSRLQEVQIFFNPARARLLNVIDGAARPHKGRVPHHDEQTCPEVRFDSTRH